MRLCGKGCDSWKYEQDEHRRHRKRWSRPGNETRKRWNVAGIGDGEEMRRLRDGLYFPSGVLLSLVHYKRTQSRDRMPYDSEDTAEGLNNDDANERNGPADQRDRQAQASFNAPVSRYPWPVASTRKSTTACHAIPKISQRDSAETRRCA